MRGGKATWARSKISWMWPKLKRHFILPIW
jgi:hypothetical protein